MQGDEKRERERDITRGRSSSSSGNQKTNNCGSVVGQPVVQLQLHCIDLGGERRVVESGIPERGLGSGCSTLARRPGGAGPDDGSLEGFRA